MALPAIRNIMERKSVRSYDSRTVEEEKIDAILRAGMAAPSGKNVQPWELVVVSDRARLEAMAEALPYAKMLKDAPVAIVVAADTRKSPVLVRRLLGRDGKYPSGGRSARARRRMDSHLPLPRTYGRGKERMRISTGHRFTVRDTARLSGSRLQTKGKIRSRKNSPRGFFNLSFLFCI